MTMRTIEYHRRTLQQYQQTMAILVRDPDKHELDIIKLAANYHLLRTKIEKAESEKLLGFDSDTYDEKTMV